MAWYLKEIDLNKHLVSTSFGSSYLVEDPAIWRMPETVELPLPVGDSRVVLRNTGRGWAHLGDIALKGYSETAWERRALVLGLQGKKLSLLWFHNRENNSQRLLEGPATFTSIRDVYVTLTGVNDGEYEIEWWNTEKGRITGRQKVAAFSGSDSDMRNPIHDDRQTLCDSKKRLDPTVKTIRKGTLGL